MLLKIGELARRTGLTVRTLHHYDAIKLLCPSGRTASGYRLYDRRDIERLHRIQALRRLDISLAEIATLLEGDSADLETVIGQQVAALDRQVARAVELRKRLKALQERIRAKEEPGLDDWLSTLAMMNFYDRYFTPEEHDQLRRHGSVDDGEFHRLKEQMRDLMETGVRPDDAQTLALAKRWIELSLKHMAGDARLIHKADVLHRTEADVPLITGIDSALLDYITRATAEYRLSLYARHLDPSYLAAARERFIRHYLKWPALFAQARELQEQGTDPLAPAALDLAARWIALFAAVWGNDVRLHEQVLKANQQEPELFAGLGMEDAAMQLVRRSIEHLKTRQGMTA
ncbi:MAG TPA: MerR family transcriptional regulator [Noviherbaspirillum sp.]|uniref:MerR family transcriptional regulator n=1 Tax=Noviherbaspirillum sp. TaxID=1926288 RepID=UPI002D523381|nr:MerR family transcriptional regulator [Noviherbaspirillum sp.]HYD94475.1 MerR family transcriptional regulator [Noviherbaspirillum sp.]